MSGQNGDGAGGRAGGFDSRPEQVAAIFKHASASFAQLGDMAAMLAGSRDTAGATNPKWTDDETARLRELVSRFGEDLAELANRMKDRTAKQIKQQLKKQDKHDEQDEQQDPKSGAKRKAEEGHMSGSADPAAGATRPKLTMSRTDGAPSGAQAPLTYADQLEDDNDHSDFDGGLSHGDDFGGMLDQRAAEWS